MKKFLLTVAFLGFLLFLAGGTVLVWGYFYITRDLPRLSSIDDYNPPAASEVFSSEGEKIAEFFKQRRYPLSLEEVPLFVRNCFLAAEDAGFYSHPGIDLMSILRAFMKNLQEGSIRQGGSTITQQVVKNLLLTPERKIERKIKEAILSYRLEQRLSKDEILEIYLNQIFFGHTAYGLRAASRVYFQKEPAELTLAEAALLAGLPKAPSRYSPIKNFSRAKKRQRYVLHQMVRAGFITEEVRQQALAEKISFEDARRQSILKAPYYAAEVRRRIEERWPDWDLETDGLKISTALDLEAEELAQKALRQGLRDVDKRRGWRGPLARFGTLDIAAYQEKFGKEAPDSLRPYTVYPALVQGVDRGRKRVEFLVGSHEDQLSLTDSKWANRFLDEEDNVRWIKAAEYLRVGDVIEVAFIPAEKKEKERTFYLSQTPEIEGAMVVINPHNGKVLTVQGGYSYSRSQFNRATQGKRQPGSAFKPVVYLAAIDGFGYTPATIVQDAPRVFRVGDDVWSPGNFDESFLGSLTLRVALERSRNLVSADIISRIGVEAAIEYARRLGIESDLGRNLSLSLGSSEVTLLEMSRAYGVFAAEGVLFDSAFITRVEDRNGNILYDHVKEKLGHAKEVVNKASAFIMANMMKGVVEHGTGYRVRALDRPAAGKTGTSNDQMDAWFIGYTPQLVCGVWAGFDLKKTIGKKETGGRVSAPIWLEFMKAYLEILDKQQYEALVEQAKNEAQQLGIEYVPPEPLDPPDFVVPEGVDPYWVNKDTGLLTTPEDPRAIYEYFREGTEPRRSAGQAEASTYLEMPEL